MAVNQRHKAAYGFGQGIYDLSPEPIVAQRAPTVHDMAPLGTIWLNQANSTAYTLIKVSNNLAVWGNQAVVGTNLANLTVNPGPTDLTGDVIVTAAAASTITLDSGTGGSALTSSGVAEVVSSRAANNAVQISATAAAGGVTIDAAAGDVIASFLAGGETHTLDNLPFTVSTGTGVLTLESDPTEGVTVSNETVSAQIMVGTGSPNGALTGAQGSIFLRTDCPDANTALYVNTDGAMTWTPLHS
jgi:hypothetical protein